ncbi:MAG: TSUP family transporter [Solirubrobacterales bacterium]
MSEIAAALMGFLGGMLGGLLGVGGGVIFVPALTIFMDETQVRAEATSLLAIVPVAMVAVWRQRGYGNVRVRDGLVIGALSPLGVGIGVVIANTVSQRALELIFAGLALVIASQLVIRALRPADRPAD